MHHALLCVKMHVYHNVVRVSIHVDLIAVITAIAIVVMNALLTAVMIVDSHVS